MLMMVTGGSGSGKSEFAESLVTGLADGPNLYIATMFPFDEDGVVDAVGWMNDRLFENKKLWDEAPSRWDTYQM